MIDRRLVAVLVGIVVVFIAGCGGAKRYESSLPYSFENGRPPVTIGFLCEGATSCRIVNDIKQCMSEYEGVRWVSKADVYSALRRAGIGKEELTSAHSFSDLPQISGLGLILLFRSSGNEQELKAVDCIDMKLSRLNLPADGWPCEELFKALGFFKVTSTPSGVDTWIDGKYYGRTPLFTKLSKGRHMVELFHPVHVFEKQLVYPPADTEIHIFRSNVKSPDSSSDAKGLFPPERESKFGESMMALSGIIVGAGLIFLPIWLLFF